MGWRIFNGDGRDMNSRLRVGLVFGGRSAEHDISLLSAGNVFRALDASKYEIILIGVTRDGVWHLCEVGANGAFPNHIPEGQAVALLPGGRGRMLLDSAALDAKAKTDLQIDVLFPMLHGPFGEDGTVQGLAELADIPFVGSGVFGSAACMDKDAAKRLLRDAGIPVARSLTLFASADLPSFASISESLGSPLFIKPARLGSSIGVAKATTEEDFSAALKNAFRFDKKVLVEEYIQAREIECGVLEGVAGELTASVPGEILPAEQHGFYSYDAKYVDDRGADVMVPAQLPLEIEKLVRERSLEIFKVLGCEGLARVDFFLTADGELILNEVNTIPGFTNISMYPKVFATSGILGPELVSRLIDHALHRHNVVNRV
jgi:D-alanine-D-alanine ligase